MHLYGSCSQVAQGRARSQVGMQLPLSTRWKMQLGLVSSALIRDLKRGKHVGPPRR